MKANTAKKMMEWQENTAANTPQTILGAKIAWRQISEEKGRGVFALTNIKKGEIIEVAPVVPVAKENVVESGEAPDGYLLNWDEENDDEMFCMPLGYIMLYNHSDAPTMAMENDMEEYIITVKALRDIKKGEELTWDYSCEIWFDEA